MTIQELAEEKSEIWRDLGYSREVQNKVYDAVIQDGNTKRAERIMHDARNEIIT